MSSCIIFPPVVKKTKSPVGVEQIDANILRAAGATAVYKDPADILAHYSEIAC